MVAIQNQPAVRYLLEVLSLSHRTRNHARRGRFGGKRQRSSRFRYRAEAEQLEGRVLLAAVGYYDMNQGQGNSSQVAAIVAAGHTPVQIFGLSAAELSGIDVLDVQNPSNSGYGSEYLAHLADIESAVASGMSLVIHDRFVESAESILPGGAGFNIIRNFDDNQNVNVLDNTTLVTNGPGGIVDDTTLDFGNSSTHGFAFSGSLPGDAATILSTGDPSHVVTFAYGNGGGTVVYSSIPLDVWRSYSNNWNNIYAPNVLAYAATNPLGGLSVSSTVPANGSTVLGSTPTEYVVNVSEPLDESTLEETDFEVNGIAAAGYSYTAGDTFVTFTFATDPVTTQGLQTMHIAEGAFASVSDGTGVREFDSSFRYDAVLMEVTSTTPADGSVVLLPFTTLDLDFNEAFDFASVEPGDFILNQGSVATVSQVDADTLRLTLDAVTAEGPLTVDLAAGAMTDVFGNAGDAFSGSYTLDIGTVPFPVPLTPSEPLGSLIYDGNRSGIIDPAGDTDSFTILVDPGQLLTVVVDSDSGLRSMVEVRNQDGELIGSVAGSAAGESAVLQNLATHGQLGQNGPPPKTYTVTVGGVDGTTGGYNLQIILNSAVENESYGGASNGTLATAQSLEPAFLPLHGSVGSDDEGRPERMAVIGQLEDYTLTTFFEEDFETDGNGFTVDNNAPGGYLDGLWHLSTGRGDQPGHSANRSFYYGDGEGPDGGGSYYVGTTMPTTGTLTSPPIDLPAGVASLVDFNQVLQTRVNPSDVDFASLQINDGNGWTTLRRYDRSAESLVWSSTAPVDLGAYAGKTVQLRWSFDTRRGPNDRSREGWYVDDIRVSVAALDDYYSLQLQAGESATVALTELSGSGAHLTLVGPDGGTLALASAGADNVDELISNFVATDSGTYYLRVTGEPGTVYSLLATRNADFDTEGNDTIETAQNLVSNKVAGHEWALGYVGLQDISGVVAEAEPNDSIVGSQDLDAEDWSLEEDPYIISSTTIPHVSIQGTGNNTFDYYSFTVPSAGDVGYFDIDLTSNLDSYLNLYDSGGSPLATSDDNGGDPGSFSGLDSRIAYQFGAAGTYIIRVGRYPGSTVPSGASYTLQVSIKNHETATGGPNADFYKIDVKQGAQLEVETRTPAHREGEFVNVLDPMVRVYDAAGNLVAQNDNGDPDGRNVRLKYKVPKGAGGTYYVEVTASDATVEPTSGEYILAVKQATGALPAFQVAATSITDGARLRGATTQLTVDFNDSLLLTSLDASDLTVYGVAATSFTVVDADTVIFDLPDLPLAEGLHDVQIAGILDLQNTPLDTFNLSFYEDLTAPRVVDISLQENEVITISELTSDLTYTVTFDEPMQTANLDNSDFNLRGVIRGVNYTPTSASYDGTGTVLTLEYADLPEDRYTLTLFSGNGRFEDTAAPNGFNLDGEPLAFPIPTNQSGDGVEGGNFVVNFELDVDTTAFPTPLTPKLPLGSLIYDPSVSGIISPSGDSDSFTINVDAGQTISVLADPASGLQPTIELRDPSNALVGTATAAANGEDAIIQTVATVAGTYTVTVIGAAGTTGQFSLELTLNAALELESHNGPDNGTLAGAQDINGSFIPLLNGATRGAVLGTAEFAGYQQSITKIDQLSNVVPPAVFNFTGVSTATGDATLTSDVTADLGGTFEWVDYYLEGTFIGQLHVNTSGDYVRDIETLTISQALINAAGGDGILSITAVPNSAVDHFSTEIHTVTLEFPTAGGGDVYSFDVAAGENITLAATAQSGGNVDLELLDAGGTVLATGSTGQTNVDEMIYNFGPLAAGTYYARISGGNSTPYSLVVTRDAVFEQEGNDTFDTAQNFDGVVGALGWMDAPTSMAEVSFADPGGDGVFTNAGDPTTAALTATPSTFGTLGWFSTSSLLCFGNASGNFSGVPTFDGLFNINSSGSYSTAMSFAFGDLIDASVGTTGWGVVGGPGVGTAGGVAPGTHYLGFRTASDHYGWINVTYSNGGTSTTTDDVITINSSYINPVAGQGIAAGATEMGDDWYSVNLTAGSTYNFPTITPGDGPGEFVNTLDPHIELYDPSGTLVVSGTPLADGRNEEITFTPTDSGLYRIRVTSEGNTFGEYFLDPVSLTAEESSMPSSNYVPVVTDRIYAQMRIDDEPLEFERETTDFVLPWVLSDDDSLLDNDDDDDEETETAFSPFLFMDEESLDAIDQLFAEDCDLCLAVGVGSEIDS